MDLKKLFEMQRQLDEHIMNEHPELKGRNNLDWKILALQVELGECANEWRGFKKWSHDQVPRTKVVKRPTMNFEDREYHNPLLEEYVDCLHFILSIGLEAYPEASLHDFGVIKLNDVTDQFLHMFLQVSGFIDLVRYVCIIETFLGLGEMLGFTWEQISKAYILKNEKNHQRQLDGY